MPGAMGIAWIAAVAAAAALLTLDATRAQPSFASCRVAISSSSQSESESVAVTAAQQTTAFICDPDGSLPAVEVTVESEALAKATATAAATAIANITVGCIASGNGSFRINGRSRATAEAEAFAAAYAETLAAAELCGGCTAAATFLGSRVEGVLLEAVAAAEVSIAAAAAEPLEVRFGIFVEEVVEATVTAIARAQSTARASVLNGCDSATLSGDGVPATLPPASPATPNPSPKPPPSPAPSPAPKPAPSPAPKPAPKPAPAPPSDPPCAGGCAGAFHRCAGAGVGGILPCCDPGFRCVSRNSFFAQCRPGGQPPRFGAWSGAILSCASAPPPDPAPVPPSTPASFVSTTTTSTTTSTGTGTSTTSGSVTIRQRFIRPL